jgi:hypothetical protein
MPDLKRLAAVASLLVACGGEDLGDPTGSTCPSDSTLTYANFGQAFFQSNCLSCHASKESPHFNTLEQIRANSSEIDRAAAAGPDAVNTFMPEDLSIDEEQRRLLGEWLACGAPE